MGLKNIAKPLTVAQALPSKIQQFMTVFYSNYGGMLKCSSAYMQ